MNDDSTDTKKSNSGLSPAGIKRAEERTARLSAALRANLHRRKEQRRSAQSAGLKNTDVEDAARAQRGPEQPIEE